MNLFDVQIYIIYVFVFIEWQILLYYQSWKIPSFHLFLKRKQGKQLECVGVLSCYWEQLTNKQGLSWAKISLNWDLVFLELKLIAID